MDQSKEFTEVDFSSSLVQHLQYKHAAHAMIFARTDRVMWAEKIPLIANVLVTTKLILYIVFRSNRIAKALWMICLQFSLCFLTRCR